MAAASRLLAAWFADAEMAVAADMTEVEEVEVRGE